MQKTPSRAALGLAALLALTGTLHPAANPPTMGNLTAREMARLEADFRAGPATVKPWVYWWWLKGNVSEQSITSDLEAMKQNGIGGFLMFDARGYWEGHVAPPPAKMEFMSPEWRRMLAFSIREANRLGLEVSVNLSSCAGALKGPWEVGEDAPKKLLWNALEVRGAQSLTCELKRPEGKRVWEVALLAARHADAPGAAKPAGAFATNWQEVALKPGAQAPVVEVVDLSGKVDAQGRLTWDAPAGHWTVLRFVGMTMEGHEYDVDILDPRAVTGHFERMGRPILQDAGALAGKTLTHFYSVSWEGAVPTWTKAFDQEFLKYRGYGGRPWWPVLAGLTVQDRELSDRFLRDYYKTLGDCFMNNFYGTLRNLSHEAGLKWHAESGGPWERKLAEFAYADQLAFLGRNDMPQGEFWWPARMMNRPSAMTAHIYGRPLAATEAFTHMMQHWSAYPAVLKPLADMALCDGINQFVWHTFTASPPELGKPGSEYFAGTHLNPRVTWWPQAGPFLRYLARGQTMLRQGKFVADVCAYVSDKNYQHWGRGTNWHPQATLRLDRGYTYDLVNTEVLLDRLSAKDGGLVLPDGMRYRLLVVDLEDETAPPQALRKIADLARAGATVVLGQRRPTRPPGLTGYPAADAEVRQLAAEIWGHDATPSFRRKLGAGEVLGGIPPAQALQSQGIQPDFTGPWDHTHRQAGDLDIYFLAGQGEAECTFRVSGKEPELWDPATGRIRDAIHYRTTADGRTTVPLQLPENGAVLVVFRKPAQAGHLVAVKAAPAAVEWMGRTRAGAQVCVWENTPAEFQTARGQTRTLKPAAWSAPLALPGPWTVEFEPGRGAPAAAVFEQLTPWNEHSDEGIRHFSGHGIYRQSFTLTAAQARQRVRLQLGVVKNIAHVRLNGRDMGIVWTAPWTADLSGAVKAGRNELEIEVANLWVNRLIGDAGLPEAKRITKTNVTLEQGQRTVKVYQGFATTDPLLPSGLLGPVRLEFGRVETVPF
jgi:hypothetical protein